MLVRGVFAAVRRSCRRSPGGLTLCQAEPPSDPLYSNSSHGEGVGTAGPPVRFENRQRDFKAAERRRLPEAEHKPEGPRGIAATRRGAGDARAGRRDILASKFTGRPDGIRGATPVPRVSRLALRLLPPENFGQPHSKKWAAMRDDKGRP